MSNYCNYCDRHFKFKDLYDQHTITCEFFYRKKRERDRSIETIEHLPTQQELYKLVQQLTLQCCKLQKDVDRLKTSSNTRTKKSIMESLNCPTAVSPPHSFESWILIKREVNHEYLELVYKEDLTAGIKKYINDLIKLETTNIPMRTFVEKPNVIYIYSADPKIENSIASWKIIPTEQFERWINRIAHRFLQEFAVMQLENIEKINSCEDEKDKNIVFMVKINGGKTSMEKRSADIKKNITGNLRFPCTNPP